MPGGADLLLLGAVGLAGICVAAASVRWPEAGALALIFLLYVRLSDHLRLGDWPLTVNQMAVALLLTAMLYRRLVVRKEGLVKDRVIGWMLVYGAAMGLSTATALDPAASLASAAAYLREVLILLVLVNLVTSVDGLRKATWTLVAAASLLAIAAALDAATGYEIAGLSSRNFGHIAGPEVGTRLAGPTSDANGFAQLLVLAVPLALYRVLGERGLMLRLGAVAAMSLSTMVIAWTFSRSGLVSLVAVLGIVAALQRFRPARLLPLVPILLSLLLAAPQFYWDRLAAAAPYATGSSSELRPVPGGDTRASDAPVLGPDDGTGAVPTDESLQFRASVWRVGALMFFEHPLTGVGRGNYFLMYPQYYWRVDASLPTEPLGPHNTPVHIAAETGLVGLTAFAIVVIVAVRGLRAAKRRFTRAGLAREAMLLEGVEVAIYGYLVTSQFLNDNLYQRFLWLLIGLAIIGRQVSLTVAAGAQRDAPAVVPATVGAGGGPLTPVSAP